ncbi:hypothetical protein CFC21_023792 [Triticum aestivum]|uniref:RRM domain-containing protein n=2 Tax=Triticum aestivum TaxID=4565 RepID=A0A3B6C780_WHEAT|nr:uncharacterized protein LOC123045484 isoform X2 [Triticum aestivum]KAF7009219.1 hypothetical protein CFC21_023792 [Triticum aestivum]
MFRTEDEEIFPCFDVLKEFFVCQGMSASENQAAEISNETDDRKGDRPWNIIRIRLPPRKKLPDASLTLSKKVPRINKTGSKEVPEMSIDSPGKNLTTAPVLGEASSHSPRMGLCNEGSSNTLSKTMSAKPESDTSGHKQPDEATYSALSKNLRVDDEEQGSDANCYAAKQGPYEEANNNILSMILPLPGKNLITAPVQGEASSHSPRMGLCNEGSSNTLSKTLFAESESDTSGHKHLDEATYSALSKNLRVDDEEQASDANCYAAKQGPCEEANNNILSMILPLPVQEVPEGHIDNSPSKNDIAPGMQGDEEHNNSPRRKLCYDTNNKEEDEEGNNGSWNLTTTAAKYEDVVEEAHHPIPTKENNAPSNPPTDPAKQISPVKRLPTSSVQATGTSRSRNTPEMKLSASVCQAVEQSTNAANTEVTTEYQEFEEKIKRTVFLVNLDNLSHQATEVKSNPSRTLSTTAIEREMFENANHTIPSKKLSDVARNQALIDRSTDPAKKRTPRKKPHTSALHATDTSQNTFGMKLPISDGQAVNQSKSAADLDSVKQYPEDNKLITDKPGKNLITTPAHGEASSHSPRVGHCNGANSNTLSKTWSAESESDTSGNKLLDEANDNTLSMNLRVAAEEQGSDPSSYAAKHGLCEEVNNISSMMLRLQLQELPRDHINNSPSKSLTTTRKQGEEEHSNSPRKKLLYNTDSKVADEEGNNPRWNQTITAVKSQEVFEEDNHPIPSKMLSGEAKNNGPSNRPTYRANKNAPHKSLCTASVQARATGTSGKTPGMKLSASVDQAVEQSTSAANMEVIEEHQELEEKIKEIVYLDNPSHKATEAKSNPSRTLSTTAIKCDVFEHANHTIPTKKLSDVVRNKAPSKRPTDPAKKITPRKKPRTSAVQATGTSQNTSGMKLSTSDGQAANQSKSAEELETIKQYQEFEEKVKRTVYLDNLSHQATEAVIKTALGQFCSIRKVSFVVNYTIPYNIPQSALVQMETEKDAEVVVSMLQDFPFMISGIPRPVRAKHATPEMFNDRPRRPGSKLKFRWVGHRDPDYEILKKSKILSRRHEVENFALIEHELDEEKSLAAQQQENLNCNRKMLETMDSVILSGMTNYISKIYSVNWNDVF